MDDCPKFFCEKCSRLSERILTIEEMAEIYAACIKETNIEVRERGIIDFDMTDYTAFESGNPPPLEQVEMLSGIVFEKFFSRINAYRKV